MHRELRQAMRNFATGVCIASTFRDGPEGRTHDAVTVNSLLSLSLDPPLVALSLHRDSGFLRDLLASGVWSVSVLDVGADDVARTFARDRAERARAIDTLSASVGTRTNTLVVDAPSSMECELRQHIEVGDHVMVIGEVVAVGLQERRPPLIFLHGKYQSLGEVR
ncbi:flavin reductase family protein [Saccharothrix longispora]|uniref:flavin reductase family protein n=1 Tax=Saccharothrix longispora TaxID=33920 RepID=UPI0028FD2209|nr:flavin reductase family protein [Saccharothrix longispora]MDU0290766.1 flavin reductase family protein [Saccharothrix longispora]